MGHLSIFIFRLTSNPFNKERKAGDSRTPLEQSTRRLRRASPTGTFAVRGVVCLVSIVSRVAHSRQVRSPSNSSRKWGTYYIIGILFKTYFKVRRHRL